MRRLALALIVAGTAACASAPMPPPVVTPKFQEFVFPAPPAAVDPETAGAHQRAWQFLQGGDVRTADREFQRLLSRAPGFYPATAGLGYVALAGAQPDRALGYFEHALQTSGEYVPALVGRAQALLRLDREIEALDALERAQAADPSLGFEARIEALRFRRTQAAIADARRLAAGGRYDAARAGYLSALEGSPDSPFLLRELADVERRAGRDADALVHLRRAVELDPADARSHVQIGEILAAGGDMEGAIRAWEAARAVEPSPDLDERIETLRARLSLARLPEAYRAIGAAPTATRGDLAALLAVRLGGLLQRAPQRPVLITDARAHWATEWILSAVRAGVLDVFPNHTFQPEAAVRRGELALAVSRALTLLGSERPGLTSAWSGARPAVRDVPPQHPLYPAVAMAVASGVLALDAQGAFQPTRLVTGAEAQAAVSRLEALSGSGAPRLD